MSKKGGAILKQSDIKPGESATDAINRLAREGYSRKNKNVSSQSFTPITVQNENGSKIYNRIQKEKQDSESKFREKNDAIKKDIDSKKNDPDFLSSQKAKREKHKEDYEKMKEYLMDNYGWNGVKPPMHTFIENVEKEMGNNFHIYQDENGDVKTFQDENSFERINQVLPFMKPLNNLGSKALKEVAGVDVDINDIQKQVTDKLGSQGMSKEKMDEKKKSISDKNDIKNERYGAEKVLGSGLTEDFKKKTVSELKSYIKQFKKVENYGDKKKNELIALCLKLQSEGKPKRIKKLKV